MNYAPTALKMPWYLKLNNATVPSVKNNFNDLPVVKKHFTAFANSVNSIGDMLKLGKAKGFISDERIQAVLNIDTQSHAGMNLLADVIRNDFWQGYSAHINSMREQIESRYLTNMPEGLKSDFVSIAQRNLSFLQISIGINQYATYNTDELNITITPTELFLTEFDLSKYQFDNRMYDAMFSLINFTMRHQLEAPAAVNDEYEWLLEEMLDGNDDVAEKIYQYWQQHNEYFELDVEEMTKALNIESLTDTIDDIGIQPIVLHVAAADLERKINNSTNDDAIIKCFSVLEIAGQTDANIAHLYKMAKELPTESLHHATDNIGDTSMCFHALYSFNSQQEYSMAESIFERTYQTGEEPVLKLEASELGLSFLQNYFETLYMKSLIQAVL
ncbi:hypothetical protein [Shewanella aestuarii]|uniref:Uncharacterized protein n=1 Tax=Shewanella aestuarii TaxID=1028752 RepID=A0A6G9QPX1_9GAMM|nr:hypothetical protein [Shewanella aestuarii]QIR16468.1 hypothetical protein HBH39_18525 [Shewanella aestuarii]